MNEHTLSVGSYTVTFPLPRVSKQHIIMTFCNSCGEIPRRCQCSAIKRLEKVTAPAGPKIRKGDWIKDQPNAHNITNEQMIAVSKQVQDTASALSAYEKDETRHGQQKWKTFETNYQRTKGITLAQSLQEIEQFAKTGQNTNRVKSPTSDQIDNKEGRTRDSNTSITSDREETSKFYVDEASRITSSSSSVQHAIPRRSNQVGNKSAKENIQFKENTAKGTNFLIQYQDKVKRSYQPKRNLV